MRGLNSLRIQDMSDIVFHLVGGRLNKLAPELAKKFRHLPVSGIMGQPNALNFGTEMLLLYWSLFLFH